MTFNVDFLSDIHSEWWSGTMFDYAAHKKSDIVIVGGDLGSDPKQSMAELRKIASVYPTVIFIDGNHEFRSDREKHYPYDFDFEKVENNLSAEIAKLPNVTYLRDKPFIKDGVAIIGRNGHWDYEIVEKINPHEAKVSMASYISAQFNEAASFARVARRDYEELKKLVIDLNKDEAVREIVIVTHTVPHEELIRYSDAIPMIANSRVGSSLMRNLPLFDDGKKISLWLFGHQHSAVEKEIGGVTYHENPRGFGKEGNTGYKPSTFKLPFRQ